MTSSRIAIIGAGPAGLSAAEILSAQGYSVTLYDSMAAPARKFLLAGKSGLNLTRAEPHETLLTRYGAASAFLAPALDAFTGADLCAWADGLGAETFVGTSQRVFPKAMKASPLLRAWLQRLTEAGVTLKTRHRFVGLEGKHPRFDTPDGPVTIAADAVLLALGGASYPRLGSDAAWVPLLSAAGVSITPLKPANCGFEIDWSETFAERFAGEPVKPVVASSAAGAIPGEFVVSKTGIEGGLIYAHSAVLRDALERGGAVVLTLDLTPGRTLEKLTRDLGRQPAKNSFANRLRKGAGLDGVKAGLLRECVPDANTLPPEALAACIKALPLPVARPKPIAGAISSAGGIALTELDANYMLTRLPGVFAAGEMLDWEAPTGGYLLTGCFATGRAAGRGMHAWLAARG